MKNIVLIMLVLFVGTVHADYYRCFVRIASTGNLPKTFFVASENEDINDAITELRRKVQRYSVGSWSAASTTTDQSQSQVQPGQICDQEIFDKAQEYFDSEKDDQYVTYKKRIAPYRYSCEFECRNKNDDGSYKGYVLSEKYRILRYGRNAW